MFDNQRKLLEHLRSILIENGVEANNIYFEKGRKHDKLRWKNHVGHNRVCILAKTPSDHRSSRNTICHLKRALRQA
jgi:hypothetical protein